jgi:hypothetical protein
MNARRQKRLHYVAQFHLAGFGEQHADRRTEMLWVGNLPQRCQIGIAGSQWA